MRIAVLADIGQPVYHVGDEAIGHAATDAIRAREHTPVLLTRDEMHTRRYFGDVETIPTAVFPWPPIERERRLAEVRQALGTADPVRSLRNIGFGELVDGLLGCDAVHIAGGGNLNSTYGWLLSERVAVALIADGLGKPLSLSGQTIGPALTVQDAGDLRAAFTPARAVGLRDAGSVGRAREFLAGSRTVDVVTHVLDDATFLDSTALLEEGDIDPAVGSLVVTLSGDALSPFRDESEAVGAWAALLDSVAKTAGLQVTFVPHMATPGAGDGDERVHRLVADAMRVGGVRLLEIGDARSARRAVAGAALVVSSRFHPVVFALAQGVPAVGICATGYAFARVQGVFENWGLSGFTLPVDAILDPSTAAGMVALVGDEGLKAHLIEQLPVRRRFATEWWDHLVAALEGDLRAAPALPRAATREAPAALVAIARRLRLFARRAQGAEQMWVDFDRASTDAAVARAEAEAFHRSRAFRLLTRAADIRRRLIRGRG